MANPTKMALMFYFGFVLIESENDSFLLFNCWLGLIKPEERGQAFCDCRCGGYGRHLLETPVVLAMLECHVCFTAPALMS